MPLLRATAETVMTADVISISPDQRVDEAARRMVEGRISALPVLDGQGALVGIISEGDLLGRSDGDRLAGQEWWLAILSGTGQMDAAVTAAAGGRRVRDVMHAPVVTVEAETPLRAVAELLRVNAIKRVPVMRAGRMVGIVSRADLLRALETAPAAVEPGGIARLTDMIGSFFGNGGQGPQAAQAVQAAQAAHPDQPSEAPLTADAFRGLVDASAQHRLDEIKAAAQAAELQRLNLIKGMMHEHLGSEMWDTLMVHARVAAAHGSREMELLRFPAGLCSDGGRSINNADPAWPGTLQGEASELYARWTRALKPAGFGLSARILDYPGGMPGSIALVLAWDVPS